MEICKGGSGAHQLCCYMSRTVGAAGGNCGLSVGDDFYLLTVGRRALVYNASLDEQCPKRQGAIQDGI